MTATTKILQSDESQLAAAIARWDDEGGLSGSAPGDAAARKSKEGSGATAEDLEAGRRLPMPLTGLRVDDGPHNSDGLLLHAWDGSERVTAFISRRVMDDWVDPKRPYGARRSLFRAQYNALGNKNLSVIGRIVTLKYQRGAAFNRQHPFVDILLADITESGEVLDVSEFVREPLPPSFRRM
jgi:hypothetical protein